MVTSNKVPEKKVVTMGDSDNGVVVVPQRTLLGEVNEHITCPLCRGYYIDATTIVECLHSFCRSCIIKHLKVKSYCPVCEMMINSAKPNIKLDKALQDIVYKLVPGLFQKEMERRQHFYSSRPGPAASATPEQRGEDTERIIFSPEDVISFSLEYTDVTDTDSISSKSSDSNDPPSTPATTRRYLQCPAVVNISHLKKFLSMKFDIDSSQFAIVILYKRVPLPDYYTLMDIAYIYNWKRNEPMRFIYQIIDYVAIRNRIFDINRKGTNFHDNKLSPATTEENANSPLPHLNDHGSEASSGTDSPMPDSRKQADDALKVDEGQISDQPKKPNIIPEKATSTSVKKSEDDVEKSQFLNSFELTAKSNALKKSPTKLSVQNDTALVGECSSKVPEKSPKPDEKQLESLKRKQQTPPTAPEMKKLRIELEKTKITNILNSYIGASGNTASTSQNTRTIDNSSKGKESPAPSKSAQGNHPTSLPTTPKEKLQPPHIPPKQSLPSAKPQTPGTHQTIPDSAGVKRSVMSPNPIPSKRKLSEALPVQQGPTAQKPISPLKIQVPKTELMSPPRTQIEPQKQPIKKIPDLKPGLPPSQSKAPQVNKVRMDLLANNSDPTIDRSKILSQVKTSMSSQNVTSPSGDPLKSLFDSCKINIPSSLSITLTDQKIDPRPPGELTTPEPKKLVNKNLSSASEAFAHKAPSPPVHNSIEIRKLPDTDPKKLTKTDGVIDNKTNPLNKTDPSALPKPLNKSSETSAKGPIPNLKPIADAKLAKQQAANFSGPITFQQTFEQQLQTLQGDKKGKGPKNKAQVPKLMPATPKALSAANKPNSLPSKPPATVETKSSTALDLSTQCASIMPQKFNRALETMQTITNLAKKQNLPPKASVPSMTPSSAFPSTSRPAATPASPLRIPAASAINQMKLDKTCGGALIHNGRSESVKSTVMKSPSMSPSVTSPNYQIPHLSPSNTQPSPRHTRSPSSSPKLVIAEEKQTGLSTEQSLMNQSNLITSTQLSNQNAPKSNSPSALGGPSTSGTKPLKPQPTVPKLAPSRVPAPPLAPPGAPYLTEYMPPHIHKALLMRQQLEMSAAWMKAQRQYDFDMYKNISNMAHPPQNDFNKDKQ